ncbi:unnamed protein product [Moneuplotes crassus]|uniref:F-box domain-containing protein n=1 Tax=Euplotes crassus TaxID=5936 RepID=A0AAD1X5M7_EUPCR|nr:unnamed protein product [Moneuplotes crassus]
MTNKKEMNKQITMLVYWIKDESGESLVFQLKQTKSGKEVLKFGMEQVLKLISQDIEKQRVTFFIMSEDSVPKKGQRLPKDIMQRCLKLFMSDASVESLKKMITCMNEHHTKKNKQMGQKENAGMKSNPTPKSARSIKNVNLNDNLPKINRKRKMKALMSGNPKKISEYLREEKRIKQKRQTEENKEEEKTVSLGKDEIDPEKCYICRLPEELLCIIIDFGTKFELDEMKKVNRYFNDLISMRRKSVTFSKQGIPFEIFKMYMTKSPQLESIQFKCTNVIKSNDIFAIEALNLVSLKTLDVTTLTGLTERALMRFVRRCKNLESLSIYAAMNIDADFYYCLRGCMKLTGFSINSSKNLPFTDLQKLHKNLDIFAKHLPHLKLKSLSLYELNDAVTTAYADCSEIAELLENLSFWTVSQKQGIDLLKDLVFFTSLKKLAICYNLIDCDQILIDEFNKEVIRDFITDACINLNTLVIGGLLDNHGAEILSEAMEKRNTIKTLKLLNCKLSDDGLVKILSKGEALEQIDITGSLLCTSGYAFKVVGSESTHMSTGRLPFAGAEKFVTNDGPLRNLREIKMSVIRHDRMPIRNMLVELFGIGIKLGLQNVG